MGHIHLHVANLEAVKTFYIDGLGFQVVTNYPGALFTSTGNYHHHIGLNVWNGQEVPAPSKNSAGLNWYTLVFPDQEARKEAAQRLEIGGANVAREGDKFVTEDPSGNTIHMVLAEN